ncbi:MAG: hypothetical protein WCR93_02750 [Bacilli bacterium]
MWSIIKENWVFCCTCGLPTKNKLKNKNEKFIIITYLIFMGLTMIPGEYSIIFFLPALITIVIGKILYSRNKLIKGLFIFTIIYIICGILLSLVYLAFLFDFIDFLMTTFG